MRKTMYICNPYNISRQCLAFEAAQERDLGVGVFRRSMFLSCHSRYLAVFAHHLESQRDRLLYPQHVLEKRGGGGGGGQLPLLHPPGYATGCIQTESDRWMVPLRSLVLSYQTQSCTLLLMVGQPRAMSYSAVWLM